MTPRKELVFGTCADACAMFRPLNWTFHRAGPSIQISGRRQQKRLVVLALEPVIASRGPNNS
jgi:hypothetical protein